MTDNKPHRYMTVELNLHDGFIGLSCWFSVMDTWLLEVEKYQAKYVEETPDAIWHVCCNYEMTVGLLEVVTDYADERVHVTGSKNARRMPVNRKRIT